MFDLFVVVLTMCLNCISQASQPSQHADSMEPYFLSQQIEAFFAKDSLFIYATLQCSNCWWHRGFDAPLLQLTPHFSIWTSSDPHIQAPQPYKFLGMCNLAPTSFGTIRALSLSHSLPIQIHTPLQLKLTEGLKISHNFMTFEDISFIHSNFLYDFRILWFLIQNNFLFRNT